MPSLAVVSLITAGPRISTDAASRSRSAFDRSVIARDVVDEPLVHPVRDLLRAKGLLAQFGEERGEAGGVEIE